MIPSLDAKLVVRSTVEWADQLWCRLISASTLVVMIAVIAGSSIIADEGDPEDRGAIGSKDDRSAAGASASIPSIPLRMSDGRPIRTIGLYQSQMDELIPEDYRPIAIERLTDGFSRLSTPIADDHTNRLNRSVYWIDVRDGLLVSRRSEIAIDAADETIVRRSLGRVNLAIEAPELSGAIDAVATLPYLENQADGDLVAVIGGKNRPSKLPFRWQLRGKSASSGWDFEMRLPRTPQTRIVLSIEPNMNLYALDGVLRRRSGPPPDAGSLQFDDRKQWYELDAGGLDRVRIGTRRRKSSKGSDPWIIRSHSVQYQVDATGLNWICHLQMQAPVEGEFPLFQFRSASVSRIIINSFEVPFTSTVRGARQNIRVQPPPGTLESQTGLTTVTIRGASPFRSNSYWVDLPMPAWLGNVEIACTVDQVQLLVPEDLRVVKWILPDDWQRQSPRSFDDGSSVYGASGPFANPSLAAPVDGLSQFGQSNNGLAETDPIGDDLVGNPPRNDGPPSATWSRVRFARRPPGESAESVLQVEMSDDSLTARTRMVVRTDPDGLAPLNIHVEPGWDIESISFPSSSRVIERPRIPAPERLYALWPEPEDMDENRVVVDFVGRRTLDSNASQLIVPATWFVTPHRIPDDRIAAVVRPPGLNWASNASLQDEKIVHSQITELGGEFLGILSPDTLLFRPRFGRTPAVSLQMPTPSYEAISQFQISRDRDELVERLQVRLETSGKGLKQVVLQTGRSRGRPPFNWSLGDQPTAPEIRLPKSAVVVGVGEQDGLYTIGLNNPNQTKRYLFGRRRYKAGDEQTLALPSVPGAASAQAQAWIGPGLNVSQKPADVRAVLSADHSNLTSDVADETIDSRNSNLRDSICLRYDPIRAPTISVSKSDQNKHVAIVWHEQVKVIASSRGVDRIEATYLLAPSAEPTLIEYEPTLRLIEFSRDGSSVALESTPQKSVTIPPRLVGEVVRLTWNRDEYQNRWIRYCKIPVISVSGVVLKSDYQVVPASDAFAPIALIHGDQTENGQYSTIDSKPGQSVTLIRRNFVLGSGWVVSLLIFALAWHLSKRSTLPLAGACIICLAAMFLWWPWRIAMIGWLIVPIISAAMLATCRDGYRSHRSAKSDSGATRNLANSSMIGNESTNDFSVETVFRILFWIVIAFPFAHTAMVAQEPPSTTIDPSTTDESLADRDDTAKTSPDAVVDSGRAINILVPVGQDGNQRGATVYVHKSLHQQIVNPRTNKTNTDASFQSAEYRVRIDQERPSAGTQNYQVVDATYRVQFEHESEDTNTLRLPFSAASVRRIELLGKRHRLIRFEPQAFDSIIAYLPSGQNYQLRATLIAPYNQSEAWNRLTLPIPPVSTSHLTIESDTDLSGLRINGTDETANAAIEQRRWSIPIGPQHQLTIAYPLDHKRPAAAPGTLERRYLIDVGRRLVSIDCELDPSTTISDGDRYQFIVNTSQSPRLTTQQWKQTAAELIGVAKRRITVVARGDHPGPIRLHWTLPINTTNGEWISPAQIAIPEVSAAALTNTAKAWVGLRCDPALQFAPLIGEETEPLSVDHFNAQWQGNLVRLDRAYVANSGLPGPVVQHKSRAAATIRQRQHLHVTADRLELEFDAELQPHSAQSVLHCLRFPSILRLQSLTLSDQALRIQTHHYDDYSEIILRDLSGTKPIQISATAVLPVELDTPFKLPSISVTDATVAANRYLVSRDPSTAISPSDGSSIRSTALPNATAVDWLRRGWSPVLNWQADLQQDTETQGAGNRSQAGDVQPPSAPNQTFQITAVPSEFDCRQVIAIDRDGQDWMMRVDVLFDTEQMPDVIDIEAPRRWCDSLEVQGALQWLRLEQNESSRQVIRIRIDKDSVSQRALTILGRLPSSEANQLSVPRVRLIGPGRRQVYLNVPDQQPNGDSILWKSSAVDTVVLPPKWTESPGRSDQVRSVLLVNNPAWMVEMQSLPTAKEEPIAYAFDANVFAQPNGTLIHCRWDLFPGDLDSVGIRLHGETIPLAAWTAGRAVEIESIARADSSNMERFDIRVPLSVSRLSQPVELLLQVPEHAADQAGLIPTLADIPVEQQWLVRHVPDRLKARHPLSPGAILLSGNDLHPRNLDSSQRELALASSIADALQSIDRGAGHSKQELAAIAKLWMTRYQSLRRQASAHSATALEQAEWQTTDRRLTELFEIYGVDSNRVPDSADRDSGPVFSNNMAGFAIEDLVGYEIEEVTPLVEADQARLVKPVSAGDRGLRTLIANGLSILLVIGLLICLIPLQKRVAPWIGNPAFWLGLLGIFGLAVAPIYMSAALIMLAIALPVFPANRSLSSTGG